MFSEVDLQRAIRMATEAHAGHHDRNGVPYIYHLFYVSAGQPTIEGKIAGLLHDSVEDGRLTLDEIGEAFGAEIEAFVDAISRRTEEPYSAYIDRVMTYDVTMRMKLTDIEHNTLIDRMDAKAAKKFPMYREAHEKISARLGLPRRHFLTPTQHDDSSDR
jgi:(p)ppGpp synthase/HD superfamily hydrolase